MANTPRRSRSEGTSKYAKRSMRSFRSCLLTYFQKRLLLSRVVVWVDHRRAERADQTCSGGRPLLVEYHGDGVKGLQIRFLGSRVESLLAQEES